MNAKETDQRACNINVWAAQWREGILLDGATALPHSRPRVDKIQRQGQGFIGHMVDLCCQAAKHAHGGQRRKELAANTRRIAGHKAMCPDEVVAKSGLKADTKRTYGGQGGHMADTCKADTDKVWRRGQSGHKADAWPTQGGHKVDTWRTNSVETRPQTRFGGGRPKRTQSGHQAGHKAVTWRTNGGQGFEARPGGHKADIWRTHKLRGARPEHMIWRPAFFFQERTPQ